MSRVRSFEKINYGLRPAKSIERKMLCEAFRRLTAFGKVELYSYVGFGSTYFSDFSLFHKALNIHNMVSIEEETSKEDRFEFNKPFKCIEMKYGSSSAMLPSLKSDSRKIIWLDYDGMISSDVLLDINTSCSKVQSGSVLIVSVNANPLQNNEIPAVDRPDFRLQELKRAVGDDKVPSTVKGKDLSNWGTAIVCRQIIKNEIESSLAVVNGTRELGCKFRYKQLFNFHYSDNAKMLTTGGIVYDEGQESLVSQCSFEDLEYIRNDTESYLIEVPNLTYKEIRCLNEQLPTKAGDVIALPSVKESDVKKYERVYRFFPTFTESNL